MSAQQRRSSTGAVRSAADTRSRKTRRTASPEAQKWKAASAEILREGSPAAIAARLADREASGDILCNSDEVDLTTDDLQDADAMDAEIALEDEDAGALDDIDQRGDSTRAISPGESFFPDDLDGDAPDAFEIRIDDDGACRFLRPHWMRGDAVTEDGEADLDEIDPRVQMFDTLATWLQKERAVFLKTAEPLALGVQALEEMKQGLPSVAPHAFLELSGISPVLMKTGKTKKTGSVESFFSRYRSAASLVWRDGRLPLEFIFGPEARMAWVACAVRQFFSEIGKPLNQQSLAQLRGITVPKAASERTALSGQSVASLAIPEFVQRANQMAGRTPWDEVLRLYFR